MEDIPDHIGDLRIDGARAGGVFPAFDDVTGAVFDFENVGDIFISTATRDGGIGICVLNQADVTAGADGDGKAIATAAITIRGIA